MVNSFYGKLTLIFCFKIHPEQTVELMDTVVIQEGEAFDS